MKYSTQQFFNLILLTLSLSTILLTMISYILYRLRQMPATTRPGSGIRTEGVFFRRYVTAGMLAANPTVAPAQVLPNIQVPKRIVPFFAVTCLVVFVSLTMAFFFRTDSSERERREAYRSLHEKGLMASFELATADTKNSGTEFLTPSQHSRADELRDLLKGKIVTLVRLPSLPGNQETAEAAAKSWEKHLTEANMTVRLKNEVDCGEGTQLLLLPQSVTMKEEDKTKITRCLSLGVNILATGPVGALNEKGTAASTDFATKIFGLAFTPSPDVESYFPTGFSALGAPYWELPAGLILDWSPTNNGYRAAAVRKNSNVPALETNYHGTPSDFARAYFQQFAMARVGWMAIDPSSRKPGTPQEDFYAQNVIDSSLAWVLGAPRARAMTWPGGARTATLFSVDSEDHFETAEQLRDLFAELKTPATFFLVSNLYQKANFLLTGQDAYELELGSHSENHQIFKDQSLLTQFDRIQISRHEIEELSGAKVRGFRAPEEKIDDATITAVRQNQLTYMATGNTYARSAPLFVGDGKLVMFPRVPLDDINFQRRKDLFDVQDMVRAATEDFNHQEAFGGLYLFNSHTQYFGKAEYHPFYRAIATLAQDRGSWVTNFGKMADWWRGRDSLIAEANISGDGNQVKVEITNNAEKPISNVSFDVDPGRAGKWLVEEVNALAARAPTAAKAFQGHITVDTIPAGGQKEFLLHRIP